MKQFFTFLTTLIIVILFFPAIINAQNNESLWFKISKGKANQGKVVKRKSEPRNAHFYQLNLVQLKARLKNVPLRRTSNKPSSVIIKFPNADGNLEAYRVMEAPVMAPELQAKHPDIRSYVGQSIENPAEIIRFSVTPLGLNTMTLSSKQGTQYIDPYTKDGNNYIVYSKRDLPVIGEDFRCGVTGGIDYSNRGTYSSKLINAGDGYMRTFRLALACTVEYSEFHWMAAGLTAGNTVQERKDAVLAAMNVTMTRVNGIYERELSIKMEIIANNEDIIFIDNDPFTPPANDDPTKLIDESQTQIDATIGSANYDIGHTFSTGAGGLAGLGVVCIDGQKARGVTGTSNPVGDAYDVDYVAHEMGHQFGANHTFNGDSASTNCSGGNRNASTAYEPGSGSTIMAYAGICSPVNVQQNSDDYFHQISLQEIWAYVTSGSGTCGVQTSTGNSAPTADAGSDYTIPSSTPYMLTGSSTDADGTGTHTYTWEEWDLGDIGAPTETTASGPIVRSFDGTIDPTVFTPKLADLRYSNGSTAWEKLSSVSRTVNFQLTVRDNDIRGGQTATDGMTINVTDTAGPFLVTSQSTSGISWVQNTTETITWDVANTDMAPVNVSNVNIWLSTDGGLTYNTNLTPGGTPNDGTEDITVPNVQAAYCRVMVEAVGNIFFAINTVDFAIGYSVSTTCTQYTQSPNFAIPDNGSSLSQFNMNVPQSVTISDINIGVDITHPYIGDLQVSVSSPNLTQVNLLTPGTCGSEANLIVKFDDGGASFSCSTAGDDLVLQSPTGSLSDWNGGDSMGNWTFGVVDTAAQDTGTLNSWYVEICETTIAPLSTDDFELSSFSIFPNPNHGEFTLKLNSNSNNDINVEVFDIGGRSLFYNSYKNTTDFNKTINLKNVRSGMYLVKVSDGQRQSTKKIVIE